MRTGGGGPAAVEATAHRDDGADRLQLAALLVFALIAGVYFVVRFGGQWAESDTGQMAQAIRLVDSTDRIAPVTRGVYGNGFGYQVVSVAIMAYTGMDVPDLQQLAYPLISVFVVLPAWMLYRELTGSGRIASIATLLLLLVPEHLFAVLRGSHERFDRAFMLAAIWLLVRSLRYRDDPPRFAIHIGVFLVLTYALAATNSLFGLSFALALVTCLILSVIALKVPGGMRRPAAETARLLPWPSIAALLLVSAFMLFLYPPFAQSLRALWAIPAALLNLILNGGSVDPYAYVLTAWVSPVAYLLLSASQFVILGVAVAVWIWLGWSWLRGGQPASDGIWMLWLLFAAFAAQGLASVINDRTGALMGNVQYRAFSLLAFTAVPLAAIALGRLRASSWLRPAAAAVVTFAIATTLLKSTLDPALANKWLFYSDAEIQSLEWADARRPGEQTWVGPDDRLAAAYAVEIGLTSAENLWVSGPGLAIEAPSTLMSDLIATQSERLGAALPDVDGQDLVYDNGEVQLYDEPAGGLEPE